MKNKIITIGLILLIIGIFIGGYFTYPHFNKCPEITHDTVLIHDTTIHHIVDSFPYYVQSDPIIIHDTIPRNIDTAKILQDYFDKHIYERKWENDSVKILLNDTIARNTPLGNDFSYKLKFPVSTIINNVDNSIHYNRYLQGGISVPLKDYKYSMIELNYVYEKGSWGIFYQGGINSIGIKKDFTIIKFRK